MKIYLGIFLAILSIPVAGLAGVAAMQFSFIWNVQQLFAVSSCVLLVMIVISVLVFRAGMRAKKSVA
ncbi:hypothetical protein [Pseudomonas sp. F3-2]|uniref:hypothetical protein n=1 Tax=Pseudomonas sp. F3-2 TaxID=3141539 RepID=UPI00315DF68B